MEFGDGIEFFSNKTILVTGATGFLAKALVEKILRVQPNVKKLYLLIRSKNTKSAFERLHDEVIGKELFRVLKERQGAKFETFIAEKLAPIDGDTSLINLGLEDNFDIHKEIDVIIHSAAVTGFQERYDLALGINTLGARNVLNFAKECPELQILVHVSTAYVSREKAGLILETPCKFGETSVKLDTIDEEKRLVENSLDDLTRKGASTKEIRDAMKRLGQNRARMYGWDNTYVFTKAMGEMLIWENKGDLPIVIVRPTMITSTYKDPFPGWIQGFGSMGILSVVYGKGLAHFTHADGDSVTDLIPVDMVANSIIVAMVTNANKPSLTIYQVGSSLRNPVTLNKLLDVNIQYFNKNPWIDEQRMPVEITKRVFFVKGRLHFLTLLASLFLKFLVLKLVDVALCHYVKVNQDKVLMRFKVSAKIAQTFKHYIFFSACFDDKNTEILRTTMRKYEMNEEEFNFDPKCIDWEDYLLNNHIPALVNYTF